MSPTQSLWSLRTHYVGDNSHVASLVRELFPSSAFHYTLRLRTAAHPFTVIVKIDRVSKPSAHVDVSGQATLLLGLIANVDRVVIALPDRRYSLTAGEATQSLGYDVKDLGRDQDTLEAYLEKRAD